MKKICLAIGKHIIKAEFVAILLLSASSLSAQDLVIPKISSEWAPHTQYSMSVKRERLIAHLKAYDAKILDFNSRCGKIPVDNTSLISACKQESAILDKESDLLDKEIEIYKADFDYTEKIYKAYSVQIENQAKQQKEIEALLPGMIIEVKQQVQQRSPNENVKGIIDSYKNNTPPLPYKKFDELESGDVILFAPKSGDLGGAVVTDVGNFGQNSQESTASHTVTYLKEINGKKIFLDNFPGEGPQIISEDQLLKKYENRDAQVAKLNYYGVAQPLKPDEAQKLYEKAIELAKKELQSEQEISHTLFGYTNYGLIGKDNLVCSEASWTLIKSTGRKIPMSRSWITKANGVDFSPADFYNNTQYFLVTPLDMSK